ncbi:sensor histidine kinase NtrY-like [Afifella sp. H1R]|uniref:sensor histidine kinase NtrY-like n=1 Tax=unclassified Afifella TaxID=2624128 RepID=UPI001F19B43D|nr:PAS domain-containing sensor histidine kinase [Afifella sp. H1R]MCF1502866.1 PAS domain-containing sensor histidine kinase [Afifella sp. H1R]
MSVATSPDLPPERIRPGFGERNRIARMVGLLAVLLALSSAIGTFLILTGQTTIEPTPAVVRAAGLLNGIVVLFLIGTVAFEATGLWIARRHGRAAARLHVRIVALFSIIAALPAILTAGIASITLNKGLDRWFAERTEAIIENSREVAQAYVQEHSRILAIDLLAIASEFNRVAPDLELNKKAIAAYLSNQAQLRGLSAIALIRRDRSVIVEGKTSTNLKVPPPPQQVFEDADEGRPALIAPGTTNLVGGVLKITSLDDVYLYLARPLDPKVTRQVRLTEESAAEYGQLQENRFGVQIAFAILFVGMALVVLLSAIWIGLGFANGLVAPIRHLIGAASKISGGNLDVSVPVQEKAGDLGILSATFNRMAGQLRSQRNALLSANSQLDERRRFTEAVLSGVSAGVIGLNADRIVTLANHPALEAIGEEETGIVGRHVNELLPELQNVLDEVANRGRGSARDQIIIAREGEPRTLNVQVTIEQSDDSSHDGFVVTLDDITDLVAAQRRSAWADVARRIAHEIKNPLTPIQLSAERIRRRFGPRIDEEKDRVVFDQCTETIIRQVGDIRRMVDEFSAFARMPKPVMEARDLRELIREAVFLQEVGNPNISFALDLPETPVEAPVDHRLVTQALTNIVKNATEAIEAVPEDENVSGEIRVRVRDDVDHAIVDVIDNGKGLPQEGREKLLEPYMTTRQKGTGLGLAIVRKVMEEHGGSIELLDARAAGVDARGACVRMNFPHTNHPAATEAETKPAERAEQESK